MPLRFGQRPMGRGPSDEAHPKAEVPEHAPKAGHRCKSRAPSQKQGIAARSTPHFGCMPQKQGIPARSTPHFGCMPHSLSGHVHRNRTCVCRAPGTGCSVGQCPDFLRHRWENSGASKHRGKQKRSGASEQEKGRQAMFYADIRKHRNACEYKWKHKDVCEHIGARQHKDVRRRWGAYQNL